MTSHVIEPFALLSIQENWLLVAWRRSCNDFRFFRPDKIKKLDMLTKQFTAHQMTLLEYFDKYH